MNTHITYSLLFARMRGSAKETGCFQRAKQFLAEFSWISIDGVIFLAAFATKIGRRRPVVSSRLRQTQLKQVRSSETGMVLFPAFDRIEIPPTDEVWKYSPWGPIVVCNKSGASFI